MKIPVKYIYIETYLPTPRCRKLRYRNAEGVCEVDIKEVSEDDMERVMRYQVPIIGDKYMIRRWVEVYRYDGRLWKISMETLHNKDFGKLNDEEYIAWRIRASNNEFENEAIICEKMKKATNNFICCNGVFLEVAKEPVYVIHTFGLGHNHGGIGTSLDVETDGYNLNLPSSRYFNALQREEAIAEAKKIALARGDTISISYIEDADIIEVFDKTAVKENPQNENWEGDEFSNKLEAITETAPDAMSAGLLVMAATLKDDILAEKETKGDIDINNGCM